MKIYLLNPPFVENFVRCGRWQGAAARSGGLDYPKWLAYSAAQLEDEYDIRLVDAPARHLSHEEVIADVKAYSPDIIIAETNFSSMSNDSGLLSTLKKETGAYTILTGPPIAQYAERLLENDGVDIVVWYEYDFIVKQIVDAIAKGDDISQIPSISFKSDGLVVTTAPGDLSTSEDLERLPFVSKIYKEHLQISDYFLSQTLYPEVQIFTGRGCPFHCTFCSWPENLMGRVYRSRSAKSIVDEFEYISKELPEVKEIFIEDDTFTINKKLVLEVCNEIHARNLSPVWSCNARATLDYETMASMKKAGCRLLIVGYESGNEEILKTIRKGETKEQMRQFTKAAKKAGLMIHADFIIGLPGETKETAKETLDFINEIRPNVVQIAVATPLPGTVFYSWVKENGYLLVDDIEQSVDKDGYQKCIISYPEFSSDEIQSTVNKALKGYYLNVRYIPVALSNIFRKNGFGELKIMLRSMISFLKYVGN